MKIEEIKEILAHVPNVRYGLMDSRTQSSPGILKVTKGERVLLFSHGPKYEELVNKALKDMGYDYKFKAGPLPWGKRIEGPFIAHNGNEYLQVIHVGRGETHYEIGNSKVPEGAVGVKRSRGPEHGINLRAYKLESIEGITVL